VELAKRSTDKRERDKHATEIKKARTFAGGGKAHGPHPRLVVRKLNKKVRKAALVSAISMHQQEDRLFIIDKLELEKMSAKQVAKCLDAFGLKTVSAHQHCRFARKRRISTKARATCPK
jgi:ribosomal protein L4